MKPDFWQHHLQSVNIIIKAANCTISLRLLKLKERKNVLIEQAIFPEWWIFKKQFSMMIIFYEISNKPQVGNHWYGCKASWTFMYTFLLLSNALHTLAVLSYISIQKWIHEKNKLQQSTSWFMWMSLIILANCLPW